MQVHQIKVPTPFYVGPVNVYLIREDPLTLIDAGPRSDESIEALRSGLASLGIRLADIKRVIITHAHADHYGLVKVILEESGAVPYIHVWDSAGVRHTPDYETYRRLLQFAGVPGEMIEKMQAGYHKFLDYAYPLENVELLKDDDEIVFEHESLKVVHTPGHTPGSICLMRVSNRVMFASDTVLKHITPNPMLSPDPVNGRVRFQSLGEYLVSMARIRSLAPTVLRGGHGDDVVDFDQHFQQLYRFTGQRQAKLLSFLPTSGDTAWNMALRMFPDVKSYHRFLALSETVAHLDYAVSEGKATVEQEEGREVYVKKDAS